MSAEGSFVISFVKEETLVREDRYQQTLNGTPEDDNIQKLLMSLDLFPSDRETYPFQYTEGSTRFCLKDEQICLAETNGYTSCEMCPRRIASDQA
jgi:hypothetical protein